MLARAKRDKERAERARAAGVDDEGKAERSRFAALTLESLTTDRDLACFPASPVQRAILRAADGLPFDDLIPDPKRREYHFGDPGARPSSKPRIVVIRSGVRSGKSLLAAIAGLIGGVLRCAFRRPLSPEEIADGAEPDPRDGLVGVRPGEIVRAPIVAAKKPNTRAVFGHMLSTLHASPVLSKLIVAGSELKESVELRRPSDGRIVLVEMVAPSQRATNIRSNWLAGIVLDEADFFDETEDPAVNLEDHIDACGSRMLPGAQIWLPSSPWSDVGTFHETFTEAFGKPGDTLAIHSDSRSLNPTLPRAEEEAEYRRDPEKASREYGGIPLPSTGKEFFPKDAVLACINHERSLCLPPLQGVTHYGGADLGFRKNSSAIAFARRENGKTRLAYYEEKRPEKGKPLKPSEVCESFALSAIAYNCYLVRGDMWSVDTAEEQFPKHKDVKGRSVSYEGFQPTGEITADHFTEFRRLMTEGALELPNDPRLLKMIGDVRQHPLPGGRIHIRLPKHGAAHADVLVAVVLACVQVPTVERRDVHAPPPCTVNFEEVGLG